MFTTFLTEFLSNTTVALTFFPLVYNIAENIGLDILSSLIIVSISTTCAFMSPVATPVNALAFGSVKGVSLKKMLLVGFLMNIISSFWLSFSVANFVPWIIQ